VVAVESVDGGQGEPAQSSRRKIGASPMPSLATVIAVTSLSIEARIALGPGVTVICGHASQLTARLQAAIEGGALGIITFGVAGGLASDLAAGDWVIGSGVRTDGERYPADQRWSQRLLAAIPGSVHAEVAGVDAPIAHSSEKLRLHARTGAKAVDMESHVAARIAALHNIPFAICRAVIDPVDRDLPPAAVVELRHDGTPDIPAICRSVMRRPAQIPALVRIAMDAWIAREALRRGRRLLGMGLACPYFSEHCAVLAHGSPPPLRRRSERVASPQGVEIEP
jgi:adenosylhomocysteine nucleosidase